MPSSPPFPHGEKNICGQLFRRPPKHDCLMSFMYNVATKVISLCKKQSLKRKITATGNKGVIGEQEYSSNHAKMGITLTWVPRTHQWGGWYIQKLCR
uniref:Uncharacterized protein n=1 Tax=Ixodes ricinus TaxID=34613 RepID=A0A131XPP3_IXORI